jgi:hypothetical protein
VGRRGDDSAGIRDDASLLRARGDVSVFIRASVASIVKKS